MDADLVQSWQYVVAKIWLAAWSFAIFGLIFDSTASMVVSIILFLGNFWFEHKYPGDDAPVTEESL